MEKLQIISHEIEPWHRCVYLKEHVKCVLFQCTALMSLVSCKLRVPTPPGKSWIFSKFQDLESPGKSLWSWKVLGIEA